MVAVDDRRHAGRGLRWAAALAGALGGAACDTAAPADAAASVPDAPAPGLYLDLAQPPVVDCDQVQLALGVRAPAPVSGLPDTAFTYALALQPPADAGAAPQAVQNTCFAVTTDAADASVYHACITGLTPGTNYVLRATVDLDAGVLQPEVYFSTPSTCLSAGMDAGQDAAGGG